MKQQILNLKNKLLIVELPEGANDIKPPIDRPYMMSYKLKGHRYQFSTIAKSVLIGKLTDITEEQFEKWAEVKRISFGKTFYHDYQNKSKWLYVKGTAKESFFSYLEAQGIYFENPYGEEPFVPFYAPYGMTIEEYNLELRAAEYKKGEWQEAEEKVWSKDNCYIFEII